MGEPPITGARKRGATIGRGFSGSITSLNTESTQSSCLDVPRSLDMAMTRWKINTKRLWNDDGDVLIYYDCLMASFKGPCRVFPRMNSLESPGNGFPKTAKWRLLQSSFNDTTYSK